MRKNRAAVVEGHGELRKEVEEEQDVPGEEEVRRGGDA